MTPLTLVSWALAISLSCATLAVALPIGRWVSEHLTGRLTRSRELKKRIAALQETVGARPDE